MAETAASDTGMTTYTVEANAFVTAEITASSEEEALRLFSSHLSHCADLKVASAYGEPILASYSLDDGEPEIVEYD